ncbi:hypothetical protein Caci_2986 [Catenulispora acidiphila DSM 44928]|uniref:Uncharacterized protein n=1 Tax=Catenulispora acidiphila (strain DSM 44928 / JCM 14897 / NBRC 102108 / NRRL B-24433 / ID139908) TaxID=479433 RepID=C7Q303_CATAD|nr:hypothetical protein [Catenulispora acidiphila]ACU71895.1 hypothetical protein Caci_2986 [Catenulispora acidiphila DSM 44928]
MATVPHSASELYDIVVTGNGQDVVDAVEAMNATHGEALTSLMMYAVANKVRDEAGAPWVWEYSTLDGATVYDTEVFWDLESLKKAVDVCFSDYTWEEVERRKIRGTSILVNRNGRYVDTGHWAYRKPQAVSD